LSANAETSGPDLAAGIPAASIAEGSTLAGHVGDDAVLLSRFDGELCAVSGTCTHYGAALARGLVTAATVRCPLHHACFDLRTGAALQAPALDPLDLWEVEVADGTVAVRRKAAERAAPARAETDVRKIVIVGGGAAGLACANELRRLGYAGAITMLSDDGDPPVDRPNLSKDFLAGQAPAEWLPLRSPDWYASNKVDLRTGTHVLRLDPATRTLHTQNGEDIAYDRLLIATGSEANRLNSPGFDRPNVHTLRTLADSRAIADAAESGTRAAIIGSSFIGLEAAAALRQRGVEVDVVSPAHVPFQAVFGAELGLFLQRLHEQQGVRFHLGCAAASYDGHSLALSNGEVIEADFVVVGIGAHPRTLIAGSAGLSVGNGVLVDSFLRTSAEDVFAAGDIASYPDPLSGEPVRIEHWVTAERQGQVAAANMIGTPLEFQAVPFFWTEQYGVSVRYVGHAAEWDRSEIDGDLEGRYVIVRYFAGDRHCASAGVGRDLEILEDGQRFERLIAEAISTP
jgi:NADPH-dependent 2,4-dienoyl-CoA reductase/sulfur reductase-like enzyme/nitrite reductase/ring-hydroxylating ferredoxin subunit